MDLLDLGRIVVGLVLLALGGELLVRGASALALRVGISSLVVGLTVVSATTSAPEFAVTVGGVWRGEPELALGNVVGSNIVNVLFILGVSSLIVPLALKRQLMRFDLPVMVALSVTLLVMSLDGRIGTVDGLILFCAVVAHVVLAVVISRREARAPGAAAVLVREPPDRSDESEKEQSGALPLGPAVLLVASGVALLVSGAALVVEGAVNTAVAFGISSLVVGLTIVAVGTSLPELATSIVATVRGEQDLAVAVVVGSNIFNIGMVLGLPALLFTGDIPVPEVAVGLDIPVMLAAAAIVWLTAFTHSTLARWEGGLFLILYTAYTGLLVLTATGHAVLDDFTTVLTWVVLPLAAVVMFVAVARHLWHRRRQQVR